MAEVRYRVCDRCGSKIVYKGWTAKLFGMIKEHNKFKVHRTYNGNQGGYDYVDRHVELCEKCTEQLINFLNGIELAEMEK